MLALSHDLCSVRSRWLDQVVVPHLAAQSIGVVENPGPTSADSPSRVVASGKATHFVPTRTPPEPQTTYSRTQADNPHEQPSSCHSQCTFGEPKPPLVAKFAEREGPARWRKHGAETTNALFDAPFRDKKRTGDAPDNTFEESKRRGDNLDIQAYIERLRAILGTAVEGLFAPQECNLLVELLVSKKNLRVPRDGRRFLAVEDANTSAEQVSAAFILALGTGRLSVPVTLQQRHRTCRAWLSTP